MDTIIHGHHSNSHLANFRWRGGIFEGQQEQLQDFLLHILVVMYTREKGNKIKGRKEIQFNVDVWKHKVHAHEN